MFSKLTIFITAGLLIINGLLFSSTLNAGQEYLNYKNDLNSLRSRYEVQFFNLLITKDDWSKTIREQAFLDMSKQGFLAAKLYLEYLDAKSYGDARKISAITQELISSNDPSVQCLVSTYLNVLKDEQNFQKELLKQKIMESAKYEVAHCVYWSAAFHANQVERNELILKAAKAGDLFSQFELYKKYKDGDGIEKDLDASFCWAQETQKTAKLAWNNVLNNVVKNARFQYIKELKVDPVQRNNKQYCNAKLKTN
jgi:TPR repeat protein